MKEETDLMLKLFLIPDPVCTVSNNWQILNNGCLC